MKSLLTDVWDDSYDTHTHVHMCFCNPQIDYTDVFSLELTISLPFYFILQDLSLKKLRINT